MRNKARQRRLEKERSKRKPVTGPPTRFNYSKADLGADKDFFLSQPESALAIASAVILSQAVKNK